MDEKQPFLLGGRDDGEVKRLTKEKRWNLRRKVGLFSLVLITFCFTIWKSGLPLVSLRNAETKGGESRRKASLDSWRWSEITPSENLDWHKCYEKFDCAKLDVPLDWLDPSEDARASIALIRYNATDRTNYKGSVMINPGGPGGSGIYFVKNLAEHYQAVVGRNYDIVSFDPRGIGATEPQISCLGSPQSDLLWSLQTPPVLDAHPGILYDTYSRSYAYSQACSRVINSNTTKSGQFVSTAYTARDMLRITKKLGQRKIHYWGFSYGTFLGLTYASLFPDYVERMVLDGNVDAIEYSHASGTHFLEDTDKVWSAFFTFCHSAGPKRCALYAPSPAKIERRVDELLEDIKIHPVIVPGSAPGERPEIVSYSTVRRVISSSLYRPILKYPLLAAALAELELGNGLPILSLSGGGIEDSLLCSSGDGEGDGLYEGSEDASNAILCSDNGGWAENATVHDFEEFLEEVEEKSKSAGATMAAIGIACVGWNVRAKWRFAGPFEGNTSHPILFIANEADNITPLVSAQRNAAGFPGSEVLLQNAFGHTSLAAPSRCVAQSIQTYFQDGTLPPRGTVCEADVQPFDSLEMKDVIGANHKDLDMALWELMKAPVVGA